MMKNKLLLLILMLCGLFLSTTDCYAQTVISFHWGENNGSVGNMPRGPVATPLVYLDAHTLTFSPTHPEYILYIKDENETVVYSTVVSETETTVVLPAALSGNYEIVLVMGNWMFTGWIDLAG